MDTLQSDKDVSKNLIIEKLRDYTLQKESIYFAYLFGSYAEGKAGKDSDIDIGMYLHGVKKEDFHRQRMDHINELQDIFKTPVDLVIMNSATPLMNHQIFRYGILIKNTDQTVLTEFRVRNMYLYEDQRYIMDKFLQKTKESIKEALGNG